MTKIEYSAPLIYAWWLRMSIHIAKAVKLLLLILLGSGMVFAEGTLPSGSGTLDDPYQVSTLNNLLWLSTTPASWSSHYVQVTDIDATATSAWNVGQGFSPIGSNVSKFSGSYDGMGHTISNLYIHRGSSDYVGLFGATGSAPISNLGLINVDIVGGSHVGGLAGSVNWGWEPVSNSYTTGSVSSSTGSYVGGLVGNSNEGLISNSYSTVSVSGMTYVGGLLGNNTSSGYVENSYSTGPVAGEMFIGGLAGGNSFFSTITTSFSTSNVSGGDAYTGGFIGWNRSSIYDCFSSGDVTRTSGLNASFGGFVGYMSEGGIRRVYSTGSVVYAGAIDPVDKGFAGALLGAPVCEDNFWDTGASNQSSAICATGKNSTEMTLVATFTDLTTAGLSFAWDFVNNPNDDGLDNDYWDIDGAGSINSGYPYFNWQNPAPEIGLRRALVNIPDGGSYDYSYQDIGSSTDIEFTIENTGSLDLNLTVPLILSGGNMDQFSIITQPSASVVAGAVSNFSVRFSPTSAGLKTAAITITNNDNDENPFDLNLLGSGTAAEMNLKQASTAISDGGSYQLLAADIGAYTDTVFTIENTGSGVLDIILPLMFGGSDPDQFSILVQPAASISAGGSSTFTVRFSPTSQGAKSAVIAIENNDSDEHPYDLVLLASTADPEIDILQASISIADGGLYEFQNVAAGAYKDAIFTVENNGSGVLSLVTPLTIGGTHPDQFSIQSQPAASIPAGGSSNFTLRFSPASRGTWEATIAIGNNDSDENPYDISLRGPVAEPEMNLKQGSGNIADGGSYSFLPVLPGTHSNVQFIIENTGSSVLNLSVPLSIDGSNSDQFSIWEQPATSIIPAGGTRSFTVRFSPTSLGEKFASLAIGNDDSDENPYNLSLQGRIVEPEMNLRQGLNSIGDGGGYNMFGQAIGTSKDVVFTIENTGSAELTIAVPLTIGGVDTDQFSVQSQPDSSIIAGATSNFTVRFLPTSGGDKTASIAIGNNDRDENPYDLSLYGTGQGPEMSLTQDVNSIEDGGTYDYGEKPDRTSTERVFTIHNTGLLALSISTPLVLEGANADQFNIIAQPSSSVAAGESSYFSVWFSPTSSGEKIASIAIQNSDFDENPYDLVLIGTGVVAPEMNLKQAEDNIADNGSFHYSFVKIGTDMDVQFTIENTGDGDLSVTSPLTLTGSNADQFSISVQPAGIVAAGGSIDFSVRFSPTSAGFKTASIAIGNTDSDENPYRFSVNGNGVNYPEINLRQSSIDILDGGSYQYGSHISGTSTDTIFTIENIGTYDLMLTTPLIISGLNADQFSVFNQPVSPVSPGGSTNFTVRFSPTSIGSKTALIEIGNSDDDENPYRLNLDGNGLAPEMDLKQGATPIVDGGNYEYGNAGMGSNTDVVFTIENTGTSVLDITLPLVITGTDADQYSIQVQPDASVSASASTSFTVRFSPTTQGAKLASIAISNNDADENPYQLALSGTGVVLEPEMNLRQLLNDIADGASHDFGDIPLSGSSDAVFTIENFGSVDLNLTTPLQLSGVDKDRFTIIVQPAVSVAPGENTTFTVRFSPVTEGEKSALIAIINNDSDENPYDLNLAGFGDASAAPEIHLMQATLDIDDGGSSDFGDIAVSAYFDVDFTIENFGNSALNLTTPLTIVGADANQFSIQAQPASIVAGNGNTSFTVRFMPASEGDKVAALAIVNNDSDENPYDLNLYGFGLPGVAPEINLKQSATNLTDGASYFYGLKNIGTDTDIEFTIYNDGPGILLLTTPLTVAGVDLNQFSLPVQPSPTVNSGSSTLFTVRFSPTMTGLKTASIAIANNDLDENPYDLLLNGSGQGVAIAEINLRQATNQVADGGSFSFGEKVIGQYIDVVFTIENLGGVSLLLTTPLLITGNDANQFSVQVQPSPSIADGAQSSFTLRFAPTSAGSKSASISIGNSDSDENPYDLSIGGEGVEDAGCTFFVVPARNGSVTVLCL